MQYESQLSNQNDYKQLGSNANVQHNGMIDKEQSTYKMCKYNSDFWQLTCVLRVKTARLKIKGSSVTNDT